METKTCLICGQTCFDAELKIPPIGKKVLVERIGCVCYQKQDISECIKNSGKSRSIDIFERTGLGKRFGHCTFETFKIYPEIMEAFETVSDFCENFNELKEKGKGILLKGDAGCGKTHLSSALARQLIFMGHNVKFIMVPVLLENIRQSYNKKNADGESNLIQELSRVELLVLDDIGSERAPSDWVREQLFILINARYENLKPTVVTTNCTGKELSDRLGSRTISRIIETSQVINIEAGDYRLKKKG
jgi:DNA replication protein DnaC